MSRQAWGLHLILLLSLLGLPVTSSSLADEGTEPWTEVPLGEFYYQNTESMLEVQLSSAAGCSGHTPGCAVPVSVQVTEHAWEVWMNPTTGAVEQRPLPAQTRDTATLLWAVESGDAVLSAADATTDAAGLGSATLSFGADPSRVRVEATYGSATSAVGTMDFFPPESESWWKDHSESLLSVTLAAGPSCAAPVTAQVMQTSWDVWHSSLGRSETRDYATSPAVGAALSWSVSSGVGTVVSAQDCTSADGCAQATVALESSPMTVQVAASFGGGQATASLEMQPDGAGGGGDSGGNSGDGQEVWSTSQTTILSALTLAAPGGYEGLNAGAPMTLEVTASGEVWETGTSNLGGSYSTLVGSSPVSGVPVTFLRVGGDGSEPTAEPVITDAEGRARITLTMGSQPSAYVAQTQASMGSPLQSAPLIFKPLLDESDVLILATREIILSLDEESFLRSRGIWPGLDVNLTPRARLVVSEIWQRSTGDQLTIQRTEPADLVMTYSINGATPQPVTSGTTLTHNVTTTGEGTLDSQTLTVLLTAVPADPALPVPPVDGTITFNLTEPPPPPPPPPTVVDRQNFGQVFLALTSSGHPAPGATCQAQLSVAYQSWDLVSYSDGSSTTENMTFGPARGAEVVFSIDETDSGFLSNGFFDAEKSIQTTTGQDGVARVDFTSGSAESILKAHCSFAGVEGSASRVIFNGNDSGNANDPWVLSQTQNQLLLQISSTLGLITVATKHRSQRHYSNNAGQTKLGTEVIAPVSNAIVSSKFGNVITGMNGVETITYSPSQGGNTTFLASWNGLTATTNHNVPVETDPPTGGGGDPGTGGGGDPGTGGGGTPINCDCSVNKLADEDCTCSTKEQVESCASTPCDTPNQNKDCGCGCSHCKNPCDTKAPTFIPAPCSRKGDEDCNCGSAMCNASLPTTGTDGTVVEGTPCGSQPPATAWKNLTPAPVPAKTPHHPARSLPIPTTSKPANPKKANLRQKAALSLAN